MLKLKSLFLDIPEPEYREIPLPSYSMLAGIAKQGVDVVKGERVGFSLKFGSLVDDKCFEPSRVKQRYYQGVAVKPPTATTKKIIDNVMAGIKGPFGERIEKPNIFGGIDIQEAVTTDLKDYIKQCRFRANELKSYEKYDDTKFKDTMLKGEEYFKDRLESRGKMLITPVMWKLAMTTAKTLKTHPFSKKCFEKKPGIELLYQPKFIAKVFGKEVKGMLDCVIVDHNEGRIYPVDLKTGEEGVESFDQVILLHKYYVQGALYRQALINLVKASVDFKDYKVMEFEFLYISKLNPYKPLIYVMNDNLHNKALQDGFIDRFGYKHKPVKSLMDDYFGCIDHEHCTYTEEVSKNKGRVMLDILK
jgi:hypothetical protein